LKPQVHYIKELIQQGENQHLDFKFAINDSKKIARSLVAFANTLGGKLLIGVKDNGNITGVRTDEEYYMAEAAANMHCRPPVYFETKVWNVDGKKVLEISIPESNNKPHLAFDELKKWLAYIRVNDENILANAVLLKTWQKQKSKSGVKISDTGPGQFLMMYLSENKQITLSEFLKKAKVSYRKAIEILSDFMVLQLIETAYIDGKYVYTAK
jgi:predicted HTH transcriptional regulator